MRIINSTLWGISEKKNLSINEPNKFKFVFSSLQELPEYNIYAITKKRGKKSRALIYESRTKSQFEYAFTPKNKKDNSFKIEALFDLDSIIVEIPGVIKINQ